jgi:hypothetical protein
VGSGQGYRVRKTIRKLLLIMDRRKVERGKREDMVKNNI